MHVCQGQHLIQVVLFYTVVLRGWLRQRMDFSGSGPLISQVRQLLQDVPMFQFLCQRSFQNHAIDGAVTLPAVAPMVEGVMKSLGRPVSPTEVYRVWNEHCDPDMHHMSLEHFEPFLRALLQDYLHNAELQTDEHRDEHRRLAVTQPLESTGYPEMATLPLPVADASIPSPKAPVAEPRPETPKTTPKAPKATAPTDPPDPKPSKDANAKDVKHAKDAKAKRPVTPSKSSSKPPAPQIQVQNKPPTSLADALSEVHCTLLPGIKELLTEEGSNSGASGSFGLPEALSRLEGLCQQLGENFFVDPEFGPTSNDPTAKKSLLPQGGTLPAEAFQKFPGHDQIAWHRPCEAWPNKHHFCGELADVRTGVFGNAWFIGALSSLSMSEEELFGHPSGYEEPLGVYPRVFWDSEFRRRGLYCFRFSKQGQWKYVVVDDRLPFHRKTSQPLFSYAVGLDSTPHIWMALIEKAFAKLHGSYFSLWLGFVDDALEDLTGWPTEKLQISKYSERKANGGPTANVKDPSILWSTLVESAKAPNSMTCLRADAGGDVVQIDPKSIGLEADVESFCTGTLGLR